MPFLPAKYIPHFAVLVLLVLAFVGGHFLWPNYIVKPSAITSANTVQPTPVIPAPAPGSNGNAVAHRWYEYLGLGKKHEVATSTNSDVATVPKPDALQTQDSSELAALKRQVGGMGILMSEIDRKVETHDKLLTVTKKDPFVPPPPSSKPAVTKKPVLALAPQKRPAARTWQQPTGKQSSPKMTSAKKVPVDEPDGEAYWDNVP